MTRWFEDYRWSKQSPIGVGLYESSPVGVAHYRFTATDAGEFVEEYDATGHFVRVCYTPQDCCYDPSWHRELRMDCLACSGTPTVAWSNTKRMSPQGSRARVHL